MRLLSFLACFVLVFAESADASVYHVAKSGNQGNDGKSLANAFPTIQQGVGVLKAGDTLIIGPGEYYESVFATNLGDKSKKTVIKAQIPGTVLLRGDMQPPAFKKVAGFKFVYSAEFERFPRLLMEIDTLSVFKRMTAVENLEFSPGSFYYDDSRKILYMSSSDMKPPSNHLYSVAVIPASGFYLLKPVNVVIEGLAATGFQSVTPGWHKYYAWGFRLEEPVGCVIRNCVAYLNGSGIALHNGGKDNVIENCVAYGNSSQFQSEGGNIVRYGGEDDVIRNCYSYLAGAKGIAFYGNGPGAVLLKNNIAWGNDLIDIRIKGRKNLKNAVAENCVALRHGMVHTMRNCLVGDNLYLRSTSLGESNVAFKTIDADKEFADPLNMDFHLQGDSTLRGTGVDGADRSPYPYEKNIFYVDSHNGKDSNDGTSTRTPWRTLKASLSKLKPGDSLYLAYGVYSDGLNLTKTAESDINLRGRGRNLITIKGNVIIDGASKTTFKRLRFHGSVKVRNSDSIEFKNCVFQSQNSALNMKNTDEIRITHCAFPASAPSFEKCEKLFLSGNIYAKGIELKKSDILYSDYNSYAKASTLNAMPDKHSTLSPLKHVNDNWNFSILNPEAFAGKGPNGTSIGIYSETAPKQLSVSNPTLHSLSDTTANLEWWTSTPAITELVWGEMPKDENAVPPKNIIKYDDVSFKHGSYSFTGLKPGSKYYFKITKGDPTEKERYRNNVGIHLHGPGFVFRTLETPEAPVTYYVAPDGNNKNSGKTRGKAFKTINQAAKLANAGDTVLIAGGTYSETVVLQASGDKGKPITFKAIPGEKVVIDGSTGSPEEPFIICGKSYLNFDGFYFKGVRQPSRWSGLFYLYRSDHINITRCFMDGRGKGNGNLFIYARKSSNIKVENCVIFNGFQGMYFVNSSNVYLEHNVFLRNWICAILASNKPDQKIYLRKNIITDSIPFKVKVHMFEINLSSFFIDDDNCYYLRAPDAKRKMFLFYDDPDVKNKPDLRDRRISLKEYKKKVRPSGSFTGNPMFKATLKMKDDGKMGKYAKAMPFDKLVGKKNLDFPDLFATNPEIVKKGIGLQPEAFK